MPSQEIAERLGQRIWQAGLLDQAIAAGFAGPFFVHVSTVAAETNDRDAAGRWVLTHSCDQVEAVDPWQGNVRDDRIETARLDDGKCGQAVACFDDLEAGGQILRVHLTRVGMILHEQHDRWIGTAGRRSERKKQHGIA